MKQITGSIAECTVNVSASYGRALLTSLAAIKYAASGILFAALLQLTASSPAPVPVRFLSATDTNFDTEKRQAPGSIRIAGDDEYDPIVEIPKRDHINDRGEAPGSIRIAGDDEYDPIVEIPKRDHINSLGDESSAVKMYNPGTVKRADAVLGGLADCARKLRKVAKSSC